MGKLIYSRKLSAEQADIRFSRSGSLTELGVMPFGYDEESNVAVREREEEKLEDEDRSSIRRFPRLERAICPNCRMLLSVVETRRGKCRTCGMEIVGAGS